MSLQILRPERGNQMLMNVNAMNSAHVLLRFYFLILQNPRLF